MWDAVLGAGLVGEYTPSPAVYLRSAAALGCRPEEVMMVAAHSWDLDVAAADLAELADLLTGAS